MKARTTKSKTKALHAVLADIERGMAEIVSEIQAERRLGRPARRDAAHAA